MPGSNVVSNPPSLREQLWKMGDIKKDFFRQKVLRIDHFQQIRKVERTIREELKTREEKGPPENA